MRYFWTAIVMSCLGLTGCGMGSSSSGSDPSTKSSNQQEIRNPPYQIAASDDLALFMCHVHQDPVGDPTHFAFYWSVRSTFTHVLPSVDWKLERIDGDPQQVMSGTISNLPDLEQGGDGHNYHADWVEQAPGSQHMYRLTVNPGHAITEAGYDNDSYIFVVDVPATATPSKVGDLEYYAREAHFHAMMPNNQYVFHFQARNRTSARIPRTKWRLQDPLEGIDNVYDLDAIAAGDVGETDQTIRLMAPGIHTVTLTLDSANQVTETDEADNVRVFRVLIGTPSGSG